jgi:hypothetical protein
LIGTDRFRREGGRFVIAIGFPEEVNLDIVVLNAFGGLEELALVLNLTDRYTECFLRRVVDIDASVVCGVNGLHNLLWEREIFADDYVEVCWALMHGDCSFP